ncbi:ferrochelatase [Thalassotalea agarivorans]|uniref:Ferrochelatase n=1 Tax=Thalassotalea agarivorans TaxID=349064 RepID=A0A1H9Y174_THASX|nr:ferrochelatase [Thalassotalea agarivorans]SES62539.1 ferrochelatase [Thalassotalea agarivorans]
MSRFKGDLAFSKKTPKTGVLLTNLGTPDAPTAPALRRYLAEFLSDPRVVEISRLIWMVILHGIILRIRPAKSAKLYDSIWTEEGSPLLAITQKQRDAVAAQLHKSYGDDVVVDIAMRYGNPSIPSRLKAMQEQGINNIIVLPLYPQYASPTTGSTFDAIAKEVGTWRWVPSISFISSYHDNPLYIRALRKSIEEHFAEHGKPEKLVFSYHGMPKRFHNLGDPYFDFCHKTTEIVTKRLGLKEDEYILTFQSRFGNAEWLKPYTDETLESLAKAGTKHIAIVSPAFSADCLETLEELEEENREIFEEAGGESYHYIPCLNAREDHIDAIVSLITPYLKNTQ